MVLTTSEERLCLFRSWRLFIRMSPEILCLVKDKKLQGEVQTDSFSCGDRVPGHSMGRSFLIKKGKIAIIHEDCDPQLAEDKGLPTSHF